MTENAPPDIRAWLTPSGNRDDGISDTRRQMLTDAGRTLGFRGGKAQRSWELIQALNARESTLNALYDSVPLSARKAGCLLLLMKRDVAHIQTGPDKNSLPCLDHPPPERLSVTRRAGVTGCCGAPTTATPGTEGRVVPEDRAQRRLWENALRQGMAEGRQR